ncbi:glycosyltransferase family 4 protein [bacterium]|nr:glycosyltransferase family 4 protein [bacterium]
MRVGMSGFAVGNSAGLGRASRTYILGLLHARPDWDFHLYLRSPEHLQMLKEEAGTQLKPLLERLNLHYPSALMGSLNRVLQENFDLPRRLRRVRPDVYLGLDFTLPPAPVCEKEAAVIYDLLPITRPETVSWRARLLYSKAIRRAVERQARLVCISDFTRRQLEENFPGRELDTQVVRLALSPHVWSNAISAAEQDHVLQVRGSQAVLCDPGRYLLYVGACGPRKNLDLLTESFRRLVESGQYNGSLVLAGGDGRYHTRASTRLGAQSQMALQAVGAQMQQGDEQPGKPEIHDLGFVNDFDLSQLYRNADLLVSFSLEEGFGYPVLEALAHGTPALVTQGSAMAEISSRGIVQTGLEPQQCVASLAAALAALPQLRQELRANPEDFNQFERLGRELATALESMR